MNAKSVSRIFDWMNTKGIGDIDFDSYTVLNGLVALSHPINTLTPEQLRALKTLFGPLKANIYGDYTRELKGERKLDDELRVTIKLTRAFECRNLEPDETTDAKWDEVRAKAMKGQITIRDCEPVLPDVPEAQEELTDHEDMRF